MQDIIYFDAETFYDREYSLSKLTTEEYLRDPRFEVIGVGVKDHPDRPPVWFSGTHREIGEFLAQYEIEKKYLCAHNTVFDGALLAWHFGIRPKYMLDTLSMARPVVGHTSKLSLAALAEKFGIGQKGDEVVAAMGKRRLDFTPAELEAYGRYCRNDIQLCYLLFNIFRQFITPKELYIIDMLLRMFTDPVFELDREKLVQHLETVRQRKQELLAKTVGLAGRDELMSNEKFAEVLRGLGVEPPTKISPRTQKETYAFAKNDLAMKALLEHPNEAVQAVVAARLGVKSTLEETRTEALIGIAERGTLPVMLNYWGAINTGRASGGDKINPQNFPRGGVIRQAMKAPKGHVVIACDSSQIEARTLAWFACQRDLEEDFRNKVDIYSAFASEVYGYPVDRKKVEIGPDGKEFHPQFLEGFVGKTCLAEGTLVLCESGWKPIEEVTTSDRVWDGVEWVCHKGLVNNGIKPTLNLSGLWLTPDHLIWSGTQWLEACSVASDASTLSQSLATARASLPSQDIFAAPAEESRRWSCDATVAQTSTPSIGATSRGSGQPAALCAHAKPGRESGTGSTSKSCLTTSTAPGSSTGWLRPSAAATTQPTGRTTITADEASPSMRSGGRTERPSCGTSKPWKDGTTQSSTWIGSTRTEAMSLATSDSCRAATTPETSGASLTLRRKLRVYDLACAGPRHRFTVLTGSGPLIVHNCILGLGYGMGAAKFRLTLANGKPPVEIDIQEAERIVRLYRNRFPMIPALWKEADEALRIVARGGVAFIGAGIRLRFDPDGLHLPNGMLLRYPDLAWNAHTREYTYHSRNGREKLYGAKLIENIIQALARIVVFEQTARIDQTLRKRDDPAGGRRFRVVLSVHDEAVAVVPEADATECQQMMEACMSTPPRWAPDLPIACESAIGISYGDCK